MYKSDRNPMFRSKFSEDIFDAKYRHEGCESWEKLAGVLVEDVCGPDKDHPDGLLSSEDRNALARIIRDLKFIPGGRYLYYAGRSRRFYNNCYLLRATEDTREDWANLSWKAESCLMTGGGIGVDYSIYRPSGSVLKGTGGVASGPIPKMLMINEIGRNVMQGGSRRSAIYASLNWKHGDVQRFLHIKDWHETLVPGTCMTLAEVKQLDFNWPAPLDMTNISLNYDTDWYMQFCKTGDPGDIFMQNVQQAVSTAEPGLSFNFFDQEDETLRNACTEVTSKDDSDVCNLGSINLGRIDSIDEMKDVVELATKFLVCGTLRAHLPYDEVYEVRMKNRRLGLGLMGIHEWLLQRKSKYEVTPELHSWLRVYRGISNRVADEFCDSLGISRPAGKRAIAPTGTTGILAGTSTGAEPIFAVAYKRRYLREGTKWHYQYVVDSAAQEMIDLYGLDPEDIESALDLASDYERRIKFQADLQDYVDHAISSTINLPRWGSRHNNPDKVRDFAMTLAHYAPRLRGFTCYPDGARGGQPLTPVSYTEARDNLGREFEEAIVTHDVCSITGHGGTCGV
jgi:ribonucleoside-diphosphate reductase alpha chain